MIENPVPGNSYRYNFKNRNYTHPRCGQCCKVLTVSPRSELLRHVLILFEDGFKLITDPVHLGKL